jgi:putative hydrolase of the HAD superfamily
LGPAEAALVLAAITEVDERGYAPRERVFTRRALEQLACEGGQAWFVGDHPRNDVLGAAGVGIKPIRLAGIHPWPEGVERPGHRIDRREEVMLAVMADSG